MKNLFAPLILILVLLAAACKDSQDAGPGKAEDAGLEKDAITGLEKISSETLAALVRAAPERFAPPWPAGTAAACTMVGPPPGADVSREGPPPRGLFGPDGSVQVPEGGPNICVWIYREDTRSLHAPPRKGVALSLARGYLPIPKVRWNAGDGIEIQAELTALIPGAGENAPSGRDAENAGLEKAENAGLFLYRVQLFNASGADKAVSVLLAIRPCGLDGSVTPLPGLELDGRTLLAGGRTLARCPSEPLGLVEIPPLAPGRPPAAAIRLDLELPAVTGEYAAATPAAELAFLLPAQTPAEWPERKEILKRYARTHVAWSGREGLDTIRFQPPDSGLADTYRAALAQLLLAASPDGVGRAPFSPEPFHCLETASAAVALNRAGRFDAARLILGGFGRVIGSDGRVPFSAGGDGTPAGPERPENNGRALFGLVDHYRFTRDGDWLAEQAAVITSAADHLAGLVGADPGRLPVPPGSGTRPPRFADAFWTLHGLGEAAFACRALDREDKAEEYEKAAALLETVLRSAVTDSMNAARIYYIPAGPLTAEAAEAPLDPEELLAIGACAWPGSFATHHDDWGMSAGSRFLTAGLEFGQPLLSLRLKKYPELILDWHAKHTTLPGLHQWAETLSLEAEGAAGPLSLRAAAAYVTLMRSIFLMEAGDYVFIAPGVSLRWFDLHKEVSVEGAVTAFGKVSYRIETKDYKSTIDFLDTAALPPRGYMMNQFYPSESPRILVDGKAYTYAARDFLLIFPSGTKRIEIDW